MEDQRHEIPSEVRFYIVAQDKAGFTQVEIVDLVLQEFDLGITQQSVSYNISKYSEEGKVEDLPRPGRPQKLSRQKKTALIKAVENNRTLTAKSVSVSKKMNPKGESHVSARTISRVLNDHGLVDSTDLTPHLDNTHVEKRLAFALKNHCERLNWTKIIFSDESDLFPDKQGKFHFRKYEGEKVDIDIGPTYGKDPRKVKVWGTISYDKVGTLIKYTGRVNKDVYLGFLKQTLLHDFPFIRGTKTRAGQYIFQQDGAPAHGAKLVRRWFIDNHIATLEWPAYSPDISIIENVWGFMKEELFKKNHLLKDQDDTWEEIQKIWYNKVPSLLKKLYLSIPNRIETIIDLDGRRIN